MPTPSVPIPVAVEVWIARSGYLRWLDALAAWLVLLGVVTLTLPGLRPQPVVVVSLVALAIGVMLRPLRIRWRPVSGWVGVTVSRRLRPGDRAWFVRDGRADTVLVTARHGLRISIAAPQLGAAETLSVRRTRVFLVPA